MALIVAVAQDELLILRALLLGMVAGGAILLWGVYRLAHTAPVFSSSLLVMVGAVMLIGGFFAVYDRGTSQHLLGCEPDGGSPPSV